MSPAALDPKQRTVLLQFKVPELLFLKLKAKAVAKHTSVSQWAREQFWRLCERQRPLTALTPLPNGRPKPGRPALPPAKTKKAPRRRTRARAAARKRTAR